MRHAHMAHNFLTERRIIDLLTGPKMCPRHVMAVGYFMMSTFTQLPNEVRRRKCMCFEFYSHFPPSNHSLWIFVDSSDGNVQLTCLQKIPKLDNFKNCQRFLAWTSCSTSVRRIATKMQVMVRQLKQAKQTHLSDLVTKSIDFLKSPLLLISGSSGGTTCSHSAL